LDYQQKSCIVMGNGQETRKGRKKMSPVVGMKFGRTKEDLFHTNVEEKEGMGIRDGFARNTQNFIL